MLPQKSERHRQGLVPLDESAFRHRRLCYAVAQHKVADRAAVSRRRASLIERRLILPSAEEADRLQRALDSLIAEAAGSVTP